MRQKLVFAAAILVVLVVALSLRLPRLGDRPFHGDEAVHAAKFRELWEHGRYQYNPDEYHGPTIYYAALPVIAAKGRATFAETREADYRLAIALLGGLMVLLYPLLRDGLGTQAVLGAALLTAVSAPFVFYSRYFIQEMALVCFTLALIACGWRYQVSHRFGWLLGAAVAAGLILATKETAVLTFAAIGLGWFAASQWPGAESEPRARVPSGHLIGATGLALAVAFVLLSGFFSHLAGPLSYWETFTPWLRRAGGTELHRQPWHYYLSLLAWQQERRGLLWTEFLVLALAALGCFAAFYPKLATGVTVQLPRFIAVYSLSLCAAYSLLPYKTPWNLLSFYLGFLLLAGFGAAVLLSLVRAAGPQPDPPDPRPPSPGPQTPSPLQVIAALLLLAGAGHLAWQSQRTTFDYRDDNTGPYAYAQPVRGVLEIEARINELAAFSPQKEDTIAQIVFTDDYHWPLPWYLRRLKHVGYWTGKVPPETEARLKQTPIILSSSDFDEELTERLSQSHFMIGFSALRPGVMVQTWVKNDLWEPFVMSKSNKQRNTE